MPVHGRYVISTAGLMLVNDRGQQPAGEHREPRFGGLRGYATCRLSVAAYRVSGAMSAPFGQQTVEPETKNPRK